MTCHDGIIEVTSVFHVSMPESQRGEIREFCVSVLHGGRTETGSPDSFYFSSKSFQVSGPCLLNSTRHVRRFSVTLLPACVPSDHHAIRKKTKNTRRGIFLYSSCSIQIIFALRIFFLPAVGVTVTNQRDRFFWSYQFVFFQDKCCKTHRQKAVSAGLAIKRCSLSSSYHFLYLWGKVCCLMTGCSCNYYPQ